MKFFDFWVFLDNKRSKSMQLQIQYLRSNLHYLLIKNWQSNPTSYSQYKRKKLIQH